MDPRLTGIHASFHGGFPRPLRPNRHTDSLVLDSCTPLFVATSFGTLETAMILLEHGANRNVEAGFGFSLLHAAALGSCRGYIKSFKEELSFDVSDGSIKNKRVWERLSSASGIQRIQLFCGSKPQSLSQIALLEHLIEAGCNPSTPDAFGFTPLHLACLHDVDIARVLVRHTKNIFCSIQIRLDATSHSCPLVVRCSPCTAFSSRWGRLGSASEAAESDKPFWVSTFML